MNARKVQRRRTKLAGAAGWWLAGVVWALVGSAGAQNRTQTPRHPVAQSDPAAAQVTVSPALQQPGPQLPPSPVAPTEAAPSVVPAAPIPSAAPAASTPTIDPPLPESPSDPSIVLGVIAFLALATAGAAATMVWNLRRRLGEVKQRQDKIDSRQDKSEQLAREKSVQAGEDFDKLSLEVQHLGNRLTEQEQSMLGHSSRPDSRFAGATSVRAAEGRTDDRFRPDDSSSHREHEPAANAARVRDPSAAGSAPTEAVARMQPATPAPTLSTLFKAVQEAADGALADGIATDPVTLTKAVSDRMAGNLATILSARRYKVSAHNSSAGLLADFNNPDFLSVTNPDGRGRLLPNPRATYAHSFTKYYEGNSGNWPQFAEAAGCFVDASGRAFLETKGRL